VAFHTGLGSAFYPTLSDSYKPYLNESSIAEFAASAYIKPNISLVVDGASEASLSKWIAHFFKDVPSSSSSSMSLNTAATRYFGGESRLGALEGNSFVIAFPGSSYSSFKPEISVLSALIGGESTIKWASGFSLLSKATSTTSNVVARTLNLVYSDAGLLAIQISGAATSVRKTAEAAVDTLKRVAEGSVSKEDLAKAIAKARFHALEGTQLRGSGLIAAGSGLLHGGKPFQYSETTMAIETVTADKLKSVSIRPSAVAKT
jgi:ubiquinol-cytochrome c reductase core subunit 2